MNKIITFVLLISCCFLSSCVDKAYNGNYYTRNHSTHIISLEFYNLGELYNSFSLIQEEEDLEIFSGFGGISGPPLYFGDSIVVIYDDSISITHINTLGEFTGRNIYWNENWKIIVDEKYRKDWEYIFIDEDYQKATGIQ